MKKMPQPNYKLGEELFNLQGQSVLVKNISLAKNGSGGDYVLYNGMYREEHLRTVPPAKKLYAYELLSGEIKWFTLDKAVCTRSDGKCVPVTAVPRPEWDKKLGGCE